MPQILNGSHGCLSLSRERVTALSCIDYFSSRGSSFFPLSSWVRIHSYYTRYKLYHAISSLGAQLEGKAELKKRDCADVVDSGDGNSGDSGGGNGTAVAGI